MDDSETIPESSRSSLAGRKPTKMILVPPEFRRVMLLRERDVLVNEILDKTSCRVLAHWKQSRITRFDIYGTGSNAERAVEIINKWISNAHVKAMAASTWAKTPAYSMNQWYAEQVNRMEDGRKAQFLGPKPNTFEGSQQSHKLIIQWPEDLTEAGAAPRDVFGNKLEKLDDIRKRDEVWITLIPGERWVIEVLGFETMHIEDAQKHIRTLMGKVRISTLNIEDTLNIILDSSEGIYVILGKPDHWWPTSAGCVVPQLMYDREMMDPGTFRSDGINSNLMLSVQNAIVNSLEAIRHDRGCYEFTIRLGCAALLNMPSDRVGKRYPKDEFLRGINSKTKLQIKKWAFENETGMDILARLMQSNDFLEPVKTAGYFGYTPETLKQTRPMFRGTWVFTDPTISTAHVVTPDQPSTQFVVRVEWTDDEDGSYEKSKVQFYKLAPSSTGPSLRMNLKLLELGESRGWNFSLESLIPVPKKLVSPALTGFADRVSMKRNYDISSHEAFAQWELSPTIKKHIVTGRLDKIYSFGVQNTWYKLELTAMWYPRQKVPVWGLAMRHAEWDLHLAELENLNMGESAQWGNTLAKFLPDDGLMAGSGDDDLGMKNLVLDDEDETPQGGIVVLMDKLMQLSELVSAEYEGVTAP